MQDVINQENTNLDYNLKEIMKAWIYSERYPIVHVTRNYANRTVEIRQEPFFPKASLLNKNSNTENEKLWHIPINCVREKNPDFDNTAPDFWLKDSSVTIPTDAWINEWIILNKQQTGN